MYWRLAIAGIAAAALGSIILLGYKNYTDLQASVVVLSENSAKQEIALEQQKTTIGTQAEALDEWSDAQDTLVARVEEAQRVAQDAVKETERLNDIFARHDLTYLARKRPGLIERRINSGTLDIIRMLECASGASGADCPDPGGTSGGTPAGAQP